MDVTKLFDTKENIAPLESARLDAMIETALAHPQIPVAANENKPWSVRALAVAAAIVLALTISLQLLPKTISSAEASEAYEEISDIVLYETMRDLS